MGGGHQKSGGAWPGYPQEIVACPVQADRQFEMGSEADLPQGAAQDTSRPGTTAQAVVTDGEETSESELLEATTLTLSDLPELHCHIARQNTLLVLPFPALAEILGLR